MWLFLSIFSVDFIIEFLTNLEANPSLYVALIILSPPPPPQEHPPHLNDPMVTQQLFVDQIIRLQKTAAKRAEKMEFLEEHNTQLIAELKKKSRIIHHYIMREEAGALANSASDSSKVNDYAFTDSKLRNALPGSVSSMLRIYLQPHLPIGKYNMF